MISISGHRILVRADKAVEIDPIYAKAKAAGFELMEDTRGMRLEQNAVDKGVIVSIGETAWKDFGGKPWAKVGDYIAFAQHAGKFLEDPFTKEKFVAINDEDLIAVLTEGVQE